MIPRASLLLFLLLLLSLTACGGEDAPEASPGLASDAPVAEPSAADAQAQLGDWGVETRFIDASVDPGNDFYRYVNAGWLDSAELPTGFSRLSSFLAVGLDTEDQIEAIVAGIQSKDWPAGSTEHNVKALYQSYMDTKRLDELGVEPIRPELAAIFAIETHEDAARTESWSETPGARPPSRGAGSARLRTVHGRSSGHPVFTPSLTEGYPVFKGGPRFAGKRFAGGRTNPGRRSS